MEKLKRSYDLALIKGAFSSVGALGRRTTSSAFIGAKLLSLSRQDVVSVIQSLKPADFYKSMTSYSNNKIWQDVYHVKYQGRSIYLKFSCSDEQHYILISFKEK